MWVSARRALIPHRTKAEVPGLVEATRRGEAEAFEQLWKWSVTRAGAVVRAYVSDATDREDLVQDIVLKAFQSLDSLHDARMFASWLDTSARRRCVDHLRRRGRVALQSLDEPVDPEDGSRMEIASSGPSVSDMVVARAMRSAARVSLEGLSAECRTLYNLRTHTSTSMREMAELAGTTEGAVKSMVYRARRRLERDLDPFLAA
jgi:RNA polymerase sigma-70 factor (ECF subfamily)